MSVYSVPTTKKKPQSVNQWAQQQAQQYINAQIAAINAQKGIYLGEVNKQADLEAERGRALAAALQEMNFPGRTQQIFGQAAGDIAGLAGGFAGEIRGTADAQAAEMARMLAGTGQEARNQGQALGDLTYGTAGFLPGPLGSSWSAVPMS